MLQKNYLQFMLVLLLLTACGSPVPASPEPTPSLTPTPGPTATPTPTPTATPIPPLNLRLQWPERVSALEPISLTLNLEPPRGLSVTAAITAALTAPDGTSYQEIEVLPGEGNRYHAAEPFQLPLVTSPGVWKLTIGVATSFPISGPTHLTFIPDPLAFHELSGTIRTGSIISVPKSFKWISMQGVPETGRLRWQYRDESLELWWTSGATEPLLYNQALTVLEATYDPQSAPTILEYEETTWKEFTAFRFQERWVQPRRSGAETWVIQGPDHWYYVLRLRNLNGETLSPLLKQIGETFIPAPKK